MNKIRFDLVGESGQLLQRIVWPVAVEQQQLKTTEQQADVNAKIAQQAVRSKKFLRAMQPRLRAVAEAHASASQEFTARRLAARTPLSQLERDKQRLERLRR